MYICVCNAIRDTDLRQAARRHPGDADAVYAFAHKLKALRVHAIKGTSHAERAIDNGFMQRAMTSEWYFARSPLPAGIVEQPLAGIVEIAGILLGSLLTGGLVSAWFLMRMANLAAFSAGHLLGPIPLPKTALLPAGMPLYVGKAVTELGG